MPRKPARSTHGSDYADLLAHVSAVLEQGRRSAARTVNAVLAASYWQVGRHIVEHEQGGRRLVTGDIRWRGAGPTPRP
jgi:hypothetical protein